MNSFSGFSPNKVEQSWILNEEFIYSLPLFGLLKFHMRWEELDIRVKLEFAEPVGMGW
jgi:hypothetical protein